MLELKADVNEITEQDFSPLYFAALAGRANVVKTLLDNKAMVDHCSETGLTALHAASQRNHYEVCIKIERHF